MEIIPRILPRRWTRVVAMIILAGSAGFMAHEVSDWSDGADKVRADIVAEQATAQKDRGLAVEAGKQAVQDPANAATYNRTAAGLYEQADAADTQADNDSRSLYPTGLMIPEAIAAGLSAVTVAMGRSAIRG